MEVIEYSGVTYKTIKINEVSENIMIQLKDINLIESQCVKNSYKVAEKINKIKLVEGFLITYFEDDSVECVAHAWNVDENSHFDITIGLKKHDKAIIKNKYYIGSIYEFRDAKLTQKPKNRSSIYDLWATETYIDFKTNVKEIEKDFRKYFENLKP